MAIAGLHDKAVMDAESQAADLQAKKTRMKLQCCMEKKDI